MEQSRRKQILVMKGLTDWALVILHLPPSVPFQVIRIKKLHTFPFITTIKKAIDLPYWRGGRIVNSQVVHGLLGGGGVLPHMAPPQL